LDSVRASDVNTVISAVVKAFTLDGSTAAAISAISLDFLAPFVLMFASGCFADATTFELTSTPALTQRASLSPGSLRPSSSVSMKAVLFAAVLFS
jgi:hypothetical protein